MPLKSRECDVLVVGGGATGLGIAWDLSLRGIKVVLIEKGETGSGTSGRYHGVLHSGARYVVSDPATARECIQENAVVRRIAAKAVDDVGGLFVQTTGDDESFVRTWNEGCRAAGIEAREISGTALRDLEPSLNPSIRTGFQVPDAVCHAMVLCASLAEAARAAGAEVLTHHRLDRFEVSAGRVHAAVVTALGSGEHLHVLPRLVVNAAGPWGGEVARAAGITLRLDLTRGALLAFEGRLVRTVVQRLRMPDDNDGLVPRGKMCIAGTTGIPTTDPSDRRVEEWESRQMREELARIVPALQQARLVHAWSAVRPLYDPKGRENGADSRRLQPGLHRAGPRSDRRRRGHPQRRWRKAFYLPPDGGAHGRLRLSEAGRHGALPDRPDSRGRSLGERSRQRADPGRQGLEAEELRVAQTLPKERHGSPSVPSTRSRQECLRALEAGPGKLRMRKGALAGNGKGLLEILNSRPGIPQRHIEIPEKTGLDGRQSWDPVPGGLLHSAAQAIGGFAVAFQERQQAQRDRHVVLRAESRCRLSFLSPRDPEVRR